MDIVHPAPAGRLSQRLFHFPHINGPRRGFQEYVARGGDVRAP